MFEDKKKITEEFDKYFVFDSYGQGQALGAQGRKDYRGLNENELKFVNVRRQHEEKEVKEVFREKILREKEKIKNAAIKKEQNFTAEIKKKEKGLIDKELLLFNESFNNISHIEGIEKVEDGDFNVDGSLLNLSINMHVGKPPIGIENMISPQYKITTPCNKEFPDKKISQKIVIDANQKNKKSKEKDLEDNILIEDLDPKDINEQNEYPDQKQRNSSKTVEGSTKISKNESSKQNKDDDSNINKNRDKDSNQIDPNQKNDEDNNDDSKSEKNLLCEQKFSKSGANFYPKIKAENVPELLRRIMEKNKKEASVKQRDGFTNLINQKNQNLNLNKNGKLILNPNRPSTRGGAAHSSKTNPFVRNQSVEDVDNNIYLELNLTDGYFWRKHEDLWNNLSTNTFKIDKDFDNYFIPHMESEIVSSIFFKENGVIKDKLIITDKIFNPKHEIKKWKEAYKIAIKRWHPDKLIPLLADLKIEDDLKNNFIVKKCGSILNSINKSLNMVVDVLKKVQNRQAPKL